MIIIMHDEFDCDILVQFCAIVRTRMFDGVSATTDSTSMRLTASTSQTFVPTTIVFGFGRSDEVEAVPQSLTPSLAESNLTTWRPRRPLAGLRASLRPVRLPQGSSAHRVLSVNASDRTTVPLRKIWIFLPDTCIAL
jgi:hypothetical protein